MNRGGGGGLEAVSRRREPLMGLIRAELGAQAAGTKAGRRPHLLLRLALLMCPGGHQWRMTASAINDGSLVPDLLLVAVPEPRACSVPAPASPHGDGLVQGVAGPFVWVDDVVRDLPPPPAAPDAGRTSRRRVGPVCCYFVKGSERGEGRREGSSRGEEREGVRWSGGEGREGKRGGRDLEEEGGFLDRARGGRGEGREGKREGEASGNTVAGGGIKNGPQTAQVSGAGNRDGLQKGKGGGRGSRVGRGLA